MQRTNVISSSIKSIGHDGKGQLEVTFNTGKIYTYDSVPFEIYQELRVAPSIGSEFHKKVVKAGYTGKQII